MLGNEADGFAVQHDGVFADGWFDLKIFLRGESDELVEFEIHGSGPGWTDVTEGNQLGWERTRYTWNADTGTVGVETLESNLWGPGSRWDYKITSAGDGSAGSTLEITLTRHGKGLKGKAIEFLLPIIGARMIKR